MSMTATITADMVKTLREKTGAGMMDVRNALSEASGDMDKATEILRQKGIASADNKSGRATSEGLIHAEIAEDGKSGALIEVNCETDFVARNENFVDMVGKLGKHVLISALDTLESILGAPMTGNSINVSDYVKENIAIIKENLSFQRMGKLSVSGPGLIQSYIHTGGKIGVLLALSTDNDSAAKTDSFKQLAKDLAMHIASCSPEFVSVDDIPQSVRDEEKRIEMGKKDLQSKPVDIREKIVAGRVEKILAQRVLYMQPFVKDPSKTVQQQVEETAKTLGASNITVQGFLRYALGETAVAEITEA